MDNDEEQISREATRWVRRNANKKALVEKFADLSVYKSDESPSAYFTAGSPGAGKTEFLKSFKPEIEKIQRNKVVVIDPDEIRTLLPGYNGKNSFLFQNAVSIAVFDLFKHCIKNRQNVFVDGTFSNYKQASDNVKYAVENYGTVNICYIFQHPSIAWHFTQLREVVEGRNIRREDFVAKFIDAMETAEQVKKDFGDCVKLRIIQKDYKDSADNKAIEAVFSDVSGIDNLIAFNYNREEIESALDEPI